MNKFEYLGFALNDKWDNDGQVKIRVAVTKAIFTRFDKYFGRKCP
jgi:hypothetical protein